ncbi:MAG: hypothetical protein JXA89_25290 [Anaerolineae bacterium]|nr:hypothetical protein [Anaerolineae bacterium]
MNDWRTPFNVDPIPPLLACQDPALNYFVRRDLLGEQAGQLDHLWALPGALKILKKQKPGGAWSRPGKHDHPAINHDLIETWRQFRFLVERYGFTRQHPQAEKAAEFIFSCQSEEGDIRGILANQYATYYTGAIMSLLIQAGYQDDPRIEKGFQWLLAMRQDDQGWTIPMLTHKFDRETQYKLTSEYANPVQLDRSKPFSHNWTGMVLRAFAVHERYRKSEAAKTAARLLTSRFFQKDVYSSYQAASYWVRFEHPFWWNNLIAALDSISLIGASKSDVQIKEALHWLVEHQRQDGLWDVTYAQDQKKEREKVREMRPWISLATCRVFVRLCD